MSTRIIHNNRKRIRGSLAGQGLVEFALVLPALLFLIMGIIEFGRAFFTYAQASNALRDSLRYGAATGFSPTSPQYADCTTMENQAEDSVWFASSAVAAVTYDLASWPGVTVDCPTLTADPSLYPIETGDRITLQNTITIDLITPLVSNITPSLTFTLEGTRTVAADVTYGAGVPALGVMSNVQVSCFEGIIGDPSDDYLIMQWDSDTTATVDWYQIFRDDSTAPIGEIDEADADLAIGGAGDGLSGCTGLAGGPLSCHDFSGGPPSTVPHRYFVQSCSASLGCSPVTEAVGGPLSCPPQSITPLQPNISAFNSACGFGEHFVQLNWTYPGDPIADQITEYHIYRGTPTGTKVREVAAPAMSCTDCDPGWDGIGPQEYYVVAFNGLESTPSTTVSVSACSEFSPFYLWDSNIAGDGGAVPPLATESSAMNLACGATDIAYDMRKDENHYWFSRPFPDPYTMPAGNYPLYVDVVTPASKDIWYDITLSVCRVATAFTMCDPVASAQDVFFPEIALPGEQTVTLVGVGSPTTDIGDRLRLEFDYDTSAPYGAQIDIGVEGACGGDYDTRVEFP